MSCVGRCHLINLKSADHSCVIRNDRFIDDHREHHYTYFTET